MGMDERNGLQREGQTRDALLGRILDVADRITKGTHKLQRVTCAVHNKAAACVVVGGGIFKNLL